MHYDTAGHFFYEMANCVIGAGMLSIAVAIVYGTLRGHSDHYKWLAILLAALFASAGAGRLFKGFDVGGYVELTADAIASFFAVLGGVLVWHVSTKMSKLPTYQEMRNTTEQLEKANDKLKAQQKVFDVFLEHNPAVAFLEDENARLIYVNAAFEEQLDVRREDVIGKSSALWAPPEHAAVIHEQNRQVMQENRPISTVLQFPTKTGKVEPWLVVRFPVESQHGKAIIGAIAINMADEYDKVQLGEKLATLVESTSDAIISKDMDGIITSWNHGAEQLFGFTHEEAIGQSITIIVPPERRHEVTEILDKIGRGLRVENFETVRVSKRDELKDVQVSVSPMRDRQGRVIGGAVISRDVTLLKKRENEIRHLNDALNKRVYELAEQSAALQAARDQALEASNLKSAFCANISHELRTPLSGILGLNEMLLIDESIGEEQRHLAKMVQESAEALLTVVNDILDLSKIEAGKITLEYAPFNPVFLLQDCTRLMAPTARAKGLKFDLTIDQDIPEMVYGDVSRMRQILLNLIGNGIKFTEQGFVQVCANVLQVDEDAVEIEFCVKDSGIGISPENQRLLFLPFGQVDSSSTRRFGGTGLGLAISKRFVEMMDGTIGLESKEGQGSRFWFRLKFDRKKLHESQDFSTERIVKPGIEPIPGNLAIGRCILVVEDNAVLQHLAMRQLSSLGIQAQSTVYGREAITMAMSDQFDVILMDINLPDISGLEAAAAIRSLEQSAKRAEIPIIAMTAGAMSGDREKAMAAGMNDYISKPVAIENLKRVVEKWLDKSQVRTYIFSSETHPIEWTGQ